MQRGHCATWTALSMDPLALGVTSVPGFTLRHATRSPQDRTSRSCCFSCQPASQSVWHKPGIYPSWPISVTQSNRSIEGAPRAAGHLGSPLWLPAGNRDNAGDHPGLAAPPSLSTPHEGAPQGAEAGRERRETNRHQTALS